jgi:hypothetical protein
MREDTYEVSVTLDGRSLGIWDTISGGAITSAELKYRPGGMRAQRSLGGSKTVENVTIARLYDEEVHALMPSLEGAVGNGRIVASKQLLTPKGAPVGSPLVYSGTLQSVSPPDHDSESDDAGRLEIEVSTDGTVGT